MDTFALSCAKLKEEMATHSSILTWRIPRTEEPGGLQSMESQSQTGLSGFHSLTPWGRRISVPALETQSLNRWPTREVLESSFSRVEGRGRERGYPPKCLTVHTPVSQEGSLSTGLCWTTGAAGSITLLGAVLDLRLVPLGAR